jgi:lipopolysaccharide transport system ATP-binding protein
MYVRLAFSVAAHLEPDILMVDEVLAVGDSEFQKKCLGKMEEVTHKEGRTILFVSHNLAAIQGLCPKSFLLDKGSLIKAGHTSDVINLYINSFLQKQEILKKNPNKKIYIDNIIVHENNPGEFTFRIIIHSQVEEKKLQIGIGIDNTFQQRLTTLFSRWYNKNLELKPGANTFQCKTNNFFLKPGNYHLNIFAGNHFEAFDYIEQATMFEVKPYSFFPSNNIPDDTQGNIMVKQDWNQ